MAKLSDPVRPDCVSIDDIALYFSGEVPKDKHLAIENHFMECEYCRALSEQVADTMQELYEQRLSPAEELVFLRQTDLSSFALPARSTILERIERWIHMGSELVAGLLLSPRGPVSFVLSEIKAMLSPSSGFNLEKAYGAASLGEDGPEEDNHLQGPVLEIPGQGRRRARVVVEIGATTQVSVQLDNVPAGTLAPLVALRLTDPSRVLMKEMEKVPSLSGDSSIIDLIARFDVPKAVHDVLVAVEPMPNDRQ